MTRNKNYRGSSRRCDLSTTSDDYSKEYQQQMKEEEHERNTSDRHIFESKMGIKDPQVQFDYTSNVFSLRGNWNTNIKVVKLYFPFIVSKNKCKKFEELVRTAFETVFLDQE